MSAFARKNLAKVADYLTTRVSQRRAYLEAAILLGVVYLLSYLFVHLVLEKLFWANPAK